MPIVNYVREHRRFIRYASDNSLTASEKLLWYALMEIFNEEAEGNVWPDEFIRISNDRVLYWAHPMGMDTMIRARNGLKQQGLIDFKPGNKNKASPAYRICYFYPESNSQNTNNMGNNIGDNMVGNIGNNIQDNMRDNMGDIYININKDLYNNQNGKEDDDDEDDRARAGEIGEAFARNFGRAAYPAEISRLASYGRMTRFSAEMIVRAIGRAAEEGAQKPVQYVLSILEDWKAEHVMQPHQIDEYRVEEDIRRGKLALAGEGSEGREARREQRRRENVEAGLEQNTDETAEVQRRWDA